MQRLESRPGGATEFVEFRITYPPDTPRKSRLAPAFVAQKGAFGLWYVFEVHPGSKGQVATLDSYKEKADAVAVAEAHARIIQSQVNHDQGGERES